MPLRCFAKYLAEEERGSASLASQPAYAHARAKVGGGREGKIPDFCDSVVHGIGSLGSRPPPFSARFNYAHA